MEKKVGRGTSEKPDWETAKIAGAAGGGHPLPDSEEARHDEIPESIERAKSQGDDSRDATQATPMAVTPEGKAYRTGDGKPGEDFARDE